MNNKDIQKNRTQHVIDRVYERYGLYVNEAIINGWRKKVQSDPTTFYACITATKTIHFLRHQGQLIYVVYSKSQKQIMTVLTEQMAFNSADDETE